jgi:hypothetical protein
MHQRAYSLWLATGLVSECNEKIPYIRFPAVLPQGRSMSFRHFSAGKTLKGKAKNN